MCYNGNQKNLFTRTKARNVAKTIQQILSADVIKSVLEKLGNQWYISMTESEWLTSQDPKAMFASLLKKGDRGIGYFVATDRKLRMFACACCCISGSKIQFVDEYEKNGPSALNESIFSDETWAREWINKSGNISQEVKANLLRDIIGNPFKPSRYTPDVTWITPTVIAIAKDAYENRVGPKCDKCEGEGGWHANPVSTLFIDWVECSICEGRGFIPNGTLNNSTLAILADALEDEGYPVPTECKECKDFSRCHIWEFLACHKTPNPYIGGEITIPLRENRPYYRGFWALDLILGKQ